MSLKASSVMNKLTSNSLTETQPWRHTDWKNVFYHLEIYLINNEQR